MTGPKTTEADDVTDAMIRDAGWFPGTYRKWRDTPYSIRRQLAFEATGCFMAFPSWSRRTEQKDRQDVCYHVDCRVARGEIKPETGLKARIREERERGVFTSMAEKRFRRVRKGILAHARAIGVFDPEELGLTVLHAPWFDPDFGA